MRLLPPVGSATHLPDRSVPGEHGDRLRTAADAELGVGVVEHQVPEPGVADREEELHDVVDPERPADLVVQVEPLSPVEDATGDGLRESVRRTVSGDERVVTPECVSHSRPDHH